MNPPRIAIVGAGMAGLTLATRLREAGVSADVFDKGRGVAGRMATRWIDAQLRQAGPTFDHGAQYFTAKDPRFAKAITAWQAGGVAAEWESVIGTLRGGAFERDPRDKQRYVGVPGNNAICVHLAEPLDVRSGVEAAPPARTVSGWQLHDAGGEPLGEFDWFVTSAPAPQSALLLATAPAFAEQAAATPMTGCWAVMVAFEEPLGLSFGGAFVEDSPLSWIACDSSKPGRPDVDGAERWVLHGSPEWSEANIELDRDAATEQLLAAFWQATGTTPRPTNYQSAHRWRYALPPEPLAEPCLFDPELRVGACGDWCGGPRVEGAFLSGLSLADRLLAVL